jgi:hypothetical protein
VQQSEHGRLAVRELDRLDRVGCSGQHQDAIHLWQSPYENEPSSVTSGAATRADERADARGVHSCEVAQVHHHKSRAPGGLAQCLFESRRRQEVQLAGDANPGRPADAGT